MTGQGKNHANICGEKGQGARETGECWAGWWCGGVGGDFLSHAEHQQLPMPQRRPRDVASRKPVQTMKCSELVARLLCGLRSAYQTNQCSQVSSVGISCRRCSCREFAHATFFLRKKKTFGRRYNALEEGFRVDVEAARLPRLLYSHPHLMRPHCIVAYGMCDRSEPGASGARGIVWQETLCDECAVGSEKLAARAWPTQDHTLTTHTQHHTTKLRQ